MSIVVTYIKKIWMQITVIILLLLAAVWQTSISCLPLRLNYGCGFLIWLYLGFIYAKFHVKLEGYIENKPGVLICLFFWVVIVLLEGSYGIYSIPSVRYPLYGLEIVGGFCGIMVVMVFSKYIVYRIDIIRSLFSYLGKISLWILCVHAVSLEITKYLPVINDDIVISSIRIVCDICIAVLLREIVSHINIHKKTV